MKKKLKGLTSEEVIASRAKYGDNSLEKEKTVGLLRKFLENLSDPIIKVLTFAVILEVIVTLGNCNWFEVGGIIIAILIATTVSTVSEYGSERAFLRMQEENSKLQSRVMRGGELLDIPADQIVVGDIVYIGAGEIIPADGVMLSGKLSVDQSALNGEGCEVPKSAIAAVGKPSLSSECHVYRGSVIVGGEGIMRVTSVGGGTYYGMVAKDIQAQTRESPLKLRLSKLAGDISKLGYIMAAVVGLTYLFFALVADNGYNGERILASLRDIPYLASTLTHALTLMITVIVVAVPEGLPMMITVVLSANMKRMLADNIMVKKLVGIETTGSMNILFTDKTGTLTTGNTSVTSLIGADREYRSERQVREVPRLYRLLAIGSISGSDTSVKNSTDKALLQFFGGADTEKVEISSTDSFTSDKKFSSVTLADGQTVFKGAPEILLSICTKELTSTGALRDMNYQSVMKKYRECAERGERVIAFTLRERDGTSVFLALAVLRDSIRAGVKETVHKMRAAGVQVVMITGDGKETAAAIARECGILQSHTDSAVLTHDEMEGLTDEELKRLIPRLRVVARAMPRDKSRLVRLSQELELVVGMTGDGINDAPSLKLADVGFAMGSGTDIAKNASDIVILDDSFLAISKTVLYGRTIFKSIRKFISFQLMMNLTACGVSLIGQFIGIDNPITIVQMLWINIIMDTLGGLAFAGEPPLEYYMQEKPKSRSEKILTPDMLGQILITGGYTLLVCVAFLRLDLFSALFRYDTTGRIFMTAFYALFVFMGLFNCFNTRSERLSLLSNIEKNKPFILIMLFIGIIQILMIYFGGELFRSVPLTAREVLNVILIAASVIPFDMIRRIMRKLFRTVN